MSEVGDAVVTRLGFLKELVLNDESRKVIFGAEGRLRFNIMSNEIELGQLRVGIEEADLVDLRIRIAEASKSEFGKAIEPTVANLRAIIQCVAGENAYHPVEDWVTALRWDGVDRLTGGLPAAFGQVPGGLEATMLRKTIRAMVARAVKPGCKVDTVLVLVGGQGRLKSTALAALGGQWFTDQQILVEQRDSWEVCHRHWLLELGELSALNRADLEQVKAFVSKRDDTFRAAYARTSRTLLRRFVLAGTTNHDEFLRDSTGNRRFWPVRITSAIDVMWLAQHREQLFAQAAKEVVGGASWWLEGEEEPEHEARAAEHLETDPWEAPIRDWCAANKGPMRLGMGLEAILHEAIDKPLGQMHTGDAKRAAAIMKRLGASQHRTNTDRLWRLE